MQDSDLIVRGKHYLTGRVYDFHVAGGFIQVIDTPAERGDVLGGDDCWVGPGLIDIQVNGYEGHDFCSPEITVDDVVAAAEGLACVGVSAFCPTVTTGSFEAMEASLRSIATACDANDVARRRIVAIHLEGPYISPIDGPRGAHPPEHVRNPDWEEFSRLQAASGERIRLLTIAPELPNALQLIQKATAAGVVVAIGHHAASREQIDAAVAAGATLCTHLGNGAHSQLPRHPNYVWEQLANDALCASIIVDGHHLPPSVVKCFYRAKGLSRLVLVSDIIAAAGLPLGKHRFMGMDIELLADGSVRLLGTPYLAGSALKLCDAISNMVRFAAVPLADAIVMATENPARVMGVQGEHGRLKVGGRADMVVFRASGDEYLLQFTIAGGKAYYPRNVAVR